MDKDLLKQQILLKIKPRPRPMDQSRAKALLARYGQKYNPGGSVNSGGSSADAGE